MEQNPEGAMARRLREGDATAFDEIFDAFNPRLLGYLVRMTKNRAVAEDLLEETWLRLVSARDSLQAETGLGPWLFTVARNLFLSHCRSKACEQSHIRDLILLWPREPARSPFDLTHHSELEQRLEAALAQLPPTFREALILVGLEGLRPGDAARVCAISAEAFRQRLSRARALLSQYMKNREHSHNMASREVGL